MGGLVILPATGKSYSIQWQSQLYTKGMSQPLSGLDEQMTPLVPTGMSVVLSLAEDLLHHLLPGGCQISSWQLRSSCLCWNEGCVSRTGVRLRLMGKCEYGS